MSGRQLRRGFGEGEGTVRGSGEGSEKIVEEGREWRGKKGTEGRPPSGLIKSITFSLDLARDSPSSHSRPFSLMPNSHNCSFFPLRRSSSYDGFASLAVSRFLRGQVHRSRLFTLILILLPAASDSRKKPLLSLPSPLFPFLLFLFIPSRHHPPFPLPPLVPLRRATLALILHKFAK